MEPLIIFGVILALFLNFVNGANDAAHSIATVVATRSLSPWRAVLPDIAVQHAGTVYLYDCRCNHYRDCDCPSRFFKPGLHHRGDGSGHLARLCCDPSGLPISSSHAMVGGLLGAGHGRRRSGRSYRSGSDNVYRSRYRRTGRCCAASMSCGVLTAALKGDVRLGILIGALFGGTLVIPLLMLAGVLNVSGLLAIVLFIFISPVMGVSAAFIFNVIISHLFRHRKQNRVRRIFRPLHVVACLFQATGHGANDGQHAVGVIAALLFSAGVLATFSIPLWVLLCSAVAIGLGTGMGGWNVVDKMAKKITRIRPYQGFSAATTGSAVLAMVTSSGYPVSSTHVISGAIVGVGATRGRTAVQWEVVTGDDDCLGNHDSLSPRPFICRVRYCQTLC